MREFDTFQESAPKALSLFIGNPAGAFHWHTYCYCPATEQANMKTYQAIARTMGAVNRCYEWQYKGRGDYSEAIKNHEATLDELMESFPHGLGFDNGTELDRDHSTGEKLIFTTSFHHMNDNGCYDGWTEHQVIVTPSLEMGFHIKVTGRDRNDMKNYIGEHFSNVLNEDVQETAKV